MGDANGSAAEQKAASSMSNRSLNWSAALRTIHADRIQVAPGVLAARTLIQGLGRMRRVSLYPLATEAERARG